jgi:hypothetical protein
MSNKLWDVFTAVFFPRSKYLLDILDDLFWIAVGFVVGVIGSWVGFACSKYGFHRLMYRTGERYKREHGANPGTMAMLWAVVCGITSGVAAVVCLAVDISDSQFSVCIGVNLVMGAVVIYYQSVTNYNGKWLDD